jgi:branched-chain amino acid transport system substrate-binding protein
MRRYLEFLERDMPGVDRADNVVASGYLAAQAMVQVIRQCGNDLTRENVMKQAANLKGFQADLLIPGIRINTAADDYSPIKDMQLMRFVGDRWQLFGDVITGTGKD